MVIKYIATGELIVIGTVYKFSVNLLYMIGRKIRHQDFNNGFHDF